MKTTTPTSGSKIADFLAHQILISEKSQKEISEELGYRKPNIITMFKQGLTKIPIEKIPGLAKALHVDPAHMLKIAMQEYMPEVYQTVSKYMGRMVSAHEWEILEAIREVNETDPELTEGMKDRLQKIFASKK